MIEGESMLYGIDDDWWDRATKPERIEALCNLASDVHDGKLRELIYRVLRDNPVLGHLEAANTLVKGDC